MSTKGQTSQRVICKIPIADPRNGFIWYISFSTLTKKGLKFKKNSTVNE